MARYEDEENTMRVFVAGASGAIGTRLVPQLIERGHEVIGTSRSPGNAERVRALGAEPIVLDLLDPHAVRQAVDKTGPDAIVHQATALANVRFSKNLDRSFAQTNRLRTEGTDALLAAAAEAGVRRFVAQSFASYRYARVGGPVKSEDDPLDPTPPAGMRETAAAMSHLDQAVTDAGGVALRYGGFYGAPNDGLLEPVRKRQFPIVASGGGVFSFIHLDDAAAATALAVEHDRAGIYNIVDDEPAPVREWLPALATALGAKPPRHVPRCSPGCSRARPGSSWEPRPAAPPTQRRSVNSGGRCAIPAGGAASWPPTQVPETPDGHVPGDFEAQCRQAWMNVISVLNEAGLATNKSWRPRPT
jgi:2-alkyl-3-oxoalkanoate reductase